MMRRDLIGETLLDQFRVETYIASGGMATIYRVWDLQRSVPLAMKVLHPELAEDPAFIARFQREADSLERLVHPHIVPFYGLYQVEDLTFMLERYIDGPSLDEVLRKRGGKPLSLAESLVYFKALYTSLGYAHAKGIVHCDVKPGNILIDQGGHVYLTDFGIARYMDSTVTTSSAMGTPLYMAPEQIRGERLTPQADIYSLGVLLFELLTGRRPFIGDGDIPEGAGGSQADRIRYQHLYLAPPDPRLYNPAIPEGVAQVILRAMAKDPSERYPTAQVMASELSQVVAARFETLPDRVNLPAVWAPASWPAQAPPVEDAAPAPWDSAEGWNATPGDTLPGLPSAARRPAPRALPERRPWPRVPREAIALSGILALLLLCGWIGVSLARRWQASGLPGFPPASTPAPAEAATTTAAASATTAATAAASATAASVTATASAAPVAGLEDFPVSGELAIVQRVDRDRLFLLDAETGFSQELPGVPNVDVQLSQAPQWSPDGERLAWMSQYNGRMHIAAMDMTEMEPYQLPAGEAYGRVSSPAWIDDRRVAFWALSGGQNRLIIADGASGEEIERLDLPGYRNLFVWNWQTGLAAFVQQAGGVYDVIISGSATGADRRIDSGGEEYAPAWSHDGQWLAFQSDAGRETGMNEIWISRADGSEARRVTHSPEGTWSRGPTWSPDGRYIAYVSDRSGSAGNDFGELFIVEVESGRIKQVTNTGGRVYDWRPAWRP